MHLLLNRSFNTLGQGQWSQELTSHHLGTNPSPVSLSGSRQSRSRTPHSPSALHRAATPQLRGMGLRKGALQPGAGKLQRRGRDAPAPMCSSAGSRAQPCARGWYLHRPGGTNLCPPRGAQPSRVTSCSTGAPLGPRAGDQLSMSSGHGPPDMGTHHPREGRRCQSKAGRAAVVQQSCPRTEPTAQHLQAQEMGALFGVEKVGMQLKT